MEQRKLEVIKIAIRLFSENGYQATSVEEIARETGIAKGSFYKLYPSKEDLLIDIVSIIPIQTKKDLFKIYSLNYQSALEKLIDFMTVNIENVLMNMSHVLMNAITEGSLAKNQKNLRVAQKVSAEMDQLLYEFYLDLYGDKIEEYVWDVVLLHNSVVIQYFFNHRKNQTKGKIKEIATFMGTIIDILVEGLLERKPPSIMNRSHPMRLISEESPLVKGREIAHLIKQLNDMVNSLKVNETERVEYAKAIHTLGQEIVQEEPKTFLIKALLTFLKTEPLLEPHSQELEQILFSH